MHIRMNITTTYTHTINNVTGVSFELRVINTNALCLNRPISCRGWSVFVSIDQSADEDGVGGRVHGALRLLEHRLEDVGVVLGEDVDGRQRRR